MSDIGLAVGDRTQFSKTVSESDVYLFAGIVGDFSANHVNEHAMRQTAFGGRIAHGALLVGYMSSCSTAMAQKAADNGCKGVPVALGFDRIRFIKPVRIGDTIRIDYVVARIEAESRKSHAEVTVSNQNDEAVAVAHHIIKWVGE
jgi:acyl dehydratase